MLKMCERILVIFMIQFCRAIHTLNNCSKMPGDKYEIFTSLIDLEHFDSMQIVDGKILSKYNGN